MLFPNKMIIIKSRRMRWAGQVATLGENGNVYRVWWKSQKRPLERIGRRWEENIKIDLRERGWVWIGLIWLRIWASGGFLLTFCFH
jgi:hypothetical protein